MEIKGSLSWISKHFNSFRYYQMKMYIVTSWEWAYMDKRTWGLFLKQYLLLWGSEKILSTEQCQVKLKLWPKIEKLVQHQTDFRWPDTKMLNILFNYISTERYRRNIGQTVSSDVTGTLNCCGLLYSFTNKY